MVKRPFLIVGVASFFAALLATAMPFSWLPFAAVLVALALPVAVVMYRLKAARVTALAAAAALLMLLGVGLKEQCVVCPTLALDGQTGFAVMRAEEVSADSRLITASVEDGMFPHGTRVRLRYDGEETVREGDLVSGEVWVSVVYREPLSEQAKTARAFGNYLNAYSTEEGALRVSDGRPSMSWEQQLVYSTRSLIHETLAAWLSPEAAALCESMLIGEHEALSADTETAFRRGGVYHLLVVSGLHVSLIAGALLKVLRVLRVPRRLRVVLTMLALLWFTALCGFSASVLRAAVMMWLVLAASFLHRRSDGLNSLGLAAFVMLLADPFCVLDLGWQLSFAATLAMVGLLPVWEREITSRLRSRCLRVGRWIAPVSTAVGASLTATLLTQPLTTLYFGELSLVFLPTNLLGVPLASAIVVLSMLLVCVGWLGALAAVFGTVIGWLCTAVTGYVSFWASLPLASLGGVPPSAILWLFALCGVIVAAYRLQAMRGVWRVLPLMLAVLCIGGTVHRVVMRDVYTVVTEASSAPFLLVRTPEGDGLIVSASADSRSTDRLLEKEGVRRLSWLLYLPSDDGEGLALSVPTEQLVLTASADAYTGFPNASSVSTLSQRQRLQIGREASVARSGDTYRLCLGETDWLLCGKTTDVSALPDGWAQADVLVLDGTLPRDVEAIRSQRVVVFGKYAVPLKIKDRLPHRFETVWLPGVEEPPAFFTRGNGDITLRMYG